MRRSSAPSSADDAPGGGSVVRVAAGVRETLRSEEERTQVSRRTILIGALVAVVAVGFGTWWLLLRSDAPPPVNLEDAVAGVTSTTGPTVDTSTGEPPDTTAVTTTTPVLETETTRPAAGSDGDWGIDTTASFAGYRVQEELASIGATEAVGRTSRLVGGLTLSGAEIAAVEVEVDMTTLQSDSSRRDGALRTRGLETDVFPTASFTLTQPIDLGAPPAVGDTIAATAIGDLTLHGVTRSVAVPIEGQLVDAGTIVVVGSVDVALADHAIEPPTGFAVLSIADTGTIELQLTFTR
jgi:polyisoprenoid-binding protein YceI